MSERKLHIISAQFKNTYACIPSMTVIKLVVIEIIIFLGITTF